MFKKKANMKYNFVLILYIISTNVCFAQIKKYQVSESITISAVVKDNNLSFIIDNGGAHRIFNYGFFELDTTIINQNRFIFYENTYSKPQFKEFIELNDSIILLNIADWNDRYYIFPFIKNSKGVVPLLQNEDKVNELFVTKLPYVYFNNKCKVLIDMYKEIMEYNYGDVSKNYFQVIIYNYNQLNNDIEKNILRLDASFWSFYSEIFTSNSKELFVNAFEKINLYLKICETKKTNTQMKK